jgi:hypothetical protein
LAAFQVTKRHIGGQESGMNRFGAILSLMVAVATTTAGPPTAATPPAPLPTAGNLPAARNGNIWNGYDHQVDRAQTRALERDQGAYPSSRQRSQQLATERSLNQQLLDARAPPALPR